MDDNAITYNLLIVGQKGVGKFSLHHQFVHDLFPSVYDPFFDDPSEQNIKECLWKHKEGKRTTTFRVRPTRDNLPRPGEHRPPAIDQTANGMILVYRINSATSFEAIKDWVKAQKKENGGVLSPKPLALVGNMTDCKRKDRKVVCFEAQEYAGDLGCAFVECSAKEGKYIEKIRQAALAKMITQKDELISLELGLIARKPRRRVIEGSDRSARESFERRNSFVNRLVSLRSSKPVLRKKSDGSISSHFASIAEDQSDETCSMWRVATLATIDESSRKSSDEGSDRSSAPSSPQSDSSYFSNFSSVSLSSSQRSRNSSETSDDMSIYTVNEEEEEELDYKHEKPLPPIPTFNLRPPMVLHETPIESLDAILKSGKLDTDSSHKRTDSMDPVITAQESVRSSQETARTSPIPESRSPHVGNIAVRQRPSTAPGAPEPPPLSMHPAFAASQKASPPPVVPMRSPRRASRPNSVIDYNPGMPSRSANVRTTHSANQGNIGLVLPPLSREAAARARQNILLQIAALMQTQTEKDEVHQEAAKTVADAVGNPPPYEAGLGISNTAEDEELRLEEEIAALRERLRRAEERKALLQTTPPLTPEEFSADLKPGNLPAGSVNMAMGISA